MQSRIMYIERKQTISGDQARIGRVTFSRTGRTLYYHGKSFRSLKGQGWKANYYDVDSGEHYWISGCKHRGSNRLYGERVPVHIDEDIRAEYWTDVRCLPHHSSTPFTY